MKKIKICEVHIKKPRTSLEYYFLLKGGLCGIEIRDTCDGANAARFVPDTPEKVYKLLLRLARYSVYPVHLGDVVHDYIYEKWLDDGSLQLLCADADACFDRGKGNVEEVGDLLAGIATDEG